MNFQIPQRIPIPKTGCVCDVSGNVYQSGIIIRSASSPDGPWQVSPTLTLPSIVAAVRSAWQAWTTNAIANNTRAITGTNNQLTALQTQLSSQQAYATALTSLETQLNG